MTQLHFGVRAFIHVLFSSCGYNVTSWFTGPRAHSLNSPATVSRRISVSGIARPGHPTNRKRNEDMWYSSSFTFVSVGFGSRWAELSHLGLSGAKVMEKTAEARVPGPSGSRVALLGLLFPSQLAKLVTLSLFNALIWDTCPRQPQT